MRKIAVQNLKGGTGKTTSSINVAHALARRGRKVLLIDADVQGNVAASLGLGRPQATLYNLLLEDLVWSACVVSARENLDVIPADSTLAVAEIQLAGLPRREETLAIRLRGVTGYDYVIVDSGPTLSLLHQNVLLFADELLIPISTEYLAMLGAQQIFQSLAFLKKYFDRAPRVAGIIPTFFDQRTNISVEVADAINQAYSQLCPVLPSIPVDTKVSQASAKKKTLFEHAPTSRAAEAYLRLAEQIDGASLSVELPAAVANV
jgi:chromosome partitioning protein